jgi:hypothetical protein
LLSVPPVVTRLAALDLCISRYLARWAAVAGPLFMVIEPLTPEGRTLASGVRFATESEAQNLSPRSGRGATRHWD